MKRYREEKTQGLEWMILFIEFFANVKRFGFVRADKWLDEAEKMRTF